MKRLYLAVEVITHLVFKDGEIVSSTTVEKPLGVRFVSDGAFMLGHHRLDELKVASEGNENVNVVEAAFSDLRGLELAKEFNEGSVFSVGELTFIGVSPFDSSLTYKDSVEFLVRSEISK